MVRRSGWVRFYLRRHVQAVEGDKTVSLLVNAKTGNTVQSTAPLPPPPSPPPVTRAGDTARAHRVNTTGRYPRRRMLGRASSRPILQAGSQPQPSVLAPPGCRVHWMAITGLHLKPGTLEKSKSHLAWRQHRGQRQAGPGCLAGQSQQ